MRDQGLLACLLLASCGGAGAPTEAETAPFRQAIVAYLQVQSMEMAPESFLSLKIDGETAVAEVQMRDKAASYGIRARWTFRFTRLGSGWRVSDVKR
jgi:hypothetical protein